MIHYNACKPRFVSAPVSCCQRPGRVHRRIPTTPQQLQDPRCSLPRRNQRTHLSRFGKPAELLPTTLFCSLRIDAAATTMLMDRGSKLHIHTFTSRWYLTPTFPFRPLWPDLLALWCTSTRIESNTSVSVVFQVDPCKYVMNLIHVLPCKYMPFRSQAMPFTSWI